MAKWSSSVAGAVVGLGSPERGDIVEDRPVERETTRGSPNDLKYALGGLHLHVAAHAAARTHGVEAHGRDACSLGDLHRLAIERGSRTVYDGT